MDAEDLTRLDATALLELMQTGQASAVDVT